MDAVALIDDINDLATLRAIAKSQQRNITELNPYKERCRELEMKLLLRDERIAELLRERWSRTSEKLAGIELNRQAELFDEIEAIVHEDRPAEDTPSITIAAHVRKRGKRAKLPADLPRIETVIDIDESEKTCGCGASMVKIGEDISEKLEVIPARFLVRRTIRPRYACARCGGAENEPERPVAVAPVPPSILPKTNATPSLLATIATWKFQDALPLYRQERIFTRHGIDLGRATMSRWMLDVATRCDAVIKAIERHIRSGPLIGMDETPTQVLGEAGRSNTAVSYMWVARGGPPGSPAIRFMYKPTRATSVPQEFLARYAGVLQTDGLESYDSALRFLNEKGHSRIAHAGCMTHARRRFVQADRSGKVPTSAKKALQYFRSLYAVEKEAQELHLDDSGRMLLRREKSLPVLLEFKSWMDQRIPEVPPESLIGKAIRYTLGQWDKLIVYIDYGFVPIDNNLVENSIRPFAIGRKNFLFSGSPEGAESSAALYSIIETAKANGHEPFFYLYYLFTMLPLAHDETAVQALLPFNVSKKHVLDFAAANWAGLGS